MDRMSLSARRTATPLTSPFALLLLWLLVTPFAASVAHADDSQVPMPPANGWPSFPRPVVRAEIPSTCGTALHNLWCHQDAKLERALEQEFWRMVGNLSSTSDPAVAGLKDWIARVSNYIGYTSRYTGLPTPQYWYGGVAGGPLKNRARLTMLVGAAHTALFRAYDLEVLIDAVQRKEVVRLINNASELPALYHLLEAIKFADEAAYLMPQHQNTLAFAYGIAAFVQWALPIEGIPRQARLERSRRHRTSALLSAWLSRRQGDAAEADGSHSSV